MLGFWKVLTYDYLLLLVKLFTYSGIDCNAPTLHLKVHQIYGSLNFKHLRQCYMVICSTILDVFSPEFTLKTRDGTEFGMEEILLVCDFSLISPCNFDCILNRLQPGLWEKYPST